MKEDKSYLQKCAMHFGTYMGMYWILKFILFPLQFYIPFFSLLFLLLTLAVPFVGYYYAKIYRNKFCNGTMGFMHGFTFSIFMYMFASLLVAVAHYFYFRYLDQGFILNAYQELWAETVRISPELKANQPIVENMLEMAKTLTPIDITMQCLSWDVMWGIILALPTALAVMKKK